MDRVKVLYDYEAEDPKELTLVKDEILTVLLREDSGWAEGKKGDGTTGWFSVAFVANYVEPSPPPKPVPQSPPPSPAPTPTTPTPNSPSHSLSSPNSPNNNNDVKLRNNIADKKKRPISSRIFKVSRTKR